MATAGTWGAVYGELLTFDDPETRLPPIDRLEGFRQGGRSLYRRVLVHPPYFTGGASTDVRDPSTRILSNPLRRDAVLFPTRLTGFF